MESKKFEDCGELCGKCQDRRALELQGRSIFHAECNGGHHTQHSSHRKNGYVVDKMEISSSQELRSSCNHHSMNNKKIRRKGRYVPVQSDVNSDTAENSSLIPGLGDDVARLCLARLTRSYYGSYFTVSKRFCSLFKSGELYKTRRGLGISEQWVYILINSVPQWQAFCPLDGGKWRSLPQTPADVCFTFADKESLTAGTQLLVVGREATGPAIWGYNLVTDKWFRAPQMITPRCLFGSASAGVHAFVAGGLDKQVESRAAERYDSSTQQWEALPDMIKTRKMCSGFFMDSKFYVIGGVNSSEGNLTCGEEYDPETKLWRLIPNMCPERSDSADHAPPLVAVADNQLYSLDTSSRQLKVYNKRSNAWNVIGGDEVPVRTDSSSGWGVAFKALDGELLLINGDAICAWKPCAGPVQWRYLAGLIPVGSFVFNCAVMSA